MKTDKIKGVEKITVVQDGLGKLDRGNADIIIGAGPAGLTAAMEELSGNPKVPVLVLEQEDRIGGLSCTVEHHGNRLDIGGHRFITGIPQIRELWLKLMPIQGRPAIDEILTKTDRKSYPGTPFANPERFDRVMLLRQRISRILFEGHLFEYPAVLSFHTIRNLGLFRMIRIFFSFLSARISPRKGKTLEDFCIRSYGMYLYRLFFEEYIRKVWGKAPSELNADGETQRLRGKILWNFSRIRKTKKTSPDMEFLYPKYGPGGLWETAAQNIHRMAGEVYTSSPVTELNMNGKRVVSVKVHTPNGELLIPCRNCFSSMPIPELIGAMRGIEIPESIREIASGLEFRALITAGILLKKGKIRKRLGTASGNDRIPDTWIYVQDRSVKMGRIQIFNNWSPYMVKDLQNTVWLGLEYFCREGDELWNMTEKAFLRMAVEELVSLGIAAAEDVLDSVRIRVPKADPSCTGTYDRMPELQKWLSSFENLFCIGRNGQHRCRKMDHAMMTGILAVHAAESGKAEARESLWNISAGEESAKTEKQRSL